MLIYIIMFDTGMDNKPIVAFTKEKDAKLWIEEDSYGYFNGNIYIQEIELIEDTNHE